MPATALPPEASAVVATGHGVAQRRARDRALFGNFYRRELTTRYLGSLSGFAWALVHPLALLAVYHFVFTSVFRTSGFEGKSFLAFVAVALWPWLAAQEALSRGTVSLSSYAGLIRKVAFPHELVVYASIAATLTLQFGGYVAVLLVLRAFGALSDVHGLIGPGERSVVERRTSVNFATSTSSRDVSLGRLVNLLMLRGRST